jgi:ABC-type bacteriocin/lantibiotic exporter with double-glycine peptidase domain
MMFYAIIGYVLSPLQSLISSNQQLQDANIAAQRLFQIMDLEQEESDGGKIELESDMMGDITFEDVAFRYGTRKDV